MEARVGVSSIRSRNGAVVRRPIFISAAVVISITGSFGCVPSFSQEYARPIAEFDSICLESKGGLAAVNEISESRGWKPSSVSQALHKDVPEWVSRSAAKSPAAQWKLLGRGGDRLLLYTDTIILNSEIGLVSVDRCMISARSDVASAAIEHFVKTFSSAPKRQAKGPPLWAFRIESGKYEVIESWGPSALSAAPAYIVTIESGDGGVSILLQRLRAASR